ncbi:MAG: PQQ-like beta-propeller repeat protein [Thermoguttaceae bacterium]|jgi:outer membrane protein assembly factor BamB|nr:PQQ-like beta-propeller repeat protein [Thermoguttaceae bacterium]
MTTAPRLAKFVASLAVFLTTACAVAQDWPQWRGPQRDGKLAGFTAPQAWPKALAEKWKTTVGLGDSTPALVGDKLYVFARQGGDEVTLCLSATDGKVLWQDKYAATSVKGAAASHPGPRSSPTVADGKVVTLGVGGVLSCLDAATGKVAWRNDEFKDVPQFFTAMSPLVVDGMCIAHLGGRDSGVVLALDLESGKPKWKWSGDGPAYASPVLMTVDGVRQVVVQTDQSLVGIALADGKLLWRVAAPVERRAQNAVTPIVDGQTVIYTGQGRGTRAVKIEKQGDAFAAKELWANAEIGTVFNTPVLKDGLLFGLSDRGNFFCMDAKTGKLLWTDTGKHDRFGAVLDAGSVILALPGNSELIAFRPSDKQYEELARIKVAETPTYAHPVIAGNRVFIKDKDAVTLFVFP